MATPDEKESVAALMGPKIFWSSLGHLQIHFNDHPSMNRNKGEFCQRDKCFSKPSKPGSRWMIFVLSQIFVIEAKRRFCIICILIDFDLMFDVCQHRKLFFRD